jgi:hypothetical protein
MDVSTGTTGVIYLGDSSRAAIEVSARGWLVVDRPGAQFWRPKGMLPLPVPRRDGSIDLLRPYLNLSEDHFRLLIVWLTAALLPEGPYPILSLHGEQVLPRAPSQEFCGT